MPGRRPPRRPGRGGLAGGLINTSFQFGPYVVSYDAATEFRFGSADDIVAELVEDRGRVLAIGSEEDAVARGMRAQRIVDVEPDRRARRSMTATPPRPGLAPAPGWRCS